MAKNTILIRSFLNIRGQSVATAVAITPGMLLERTSGLLVQKHSTAAGPVEKLFALEDAEQGKGITDDYAVSVPIQHIKPVPGERVYAIASGTVTKGEFVESSGDGSVRTYTGQASGGAAEATNSIIGVALETVSTTERVIIEIC